MLNQFDVNDRVVLITGSSRGLGFEFAKGFVEAGAKVILNGINKGRLESSVAALQKYQTNIFGYPFDVTDSIAVKQAIESIETDIGPIDILINNAGIHRRSPLSEMTMDDWKTVMDTNLNAVFYISQCVANRMKERKKGKIINITSLNAVGVRPTIANYCAAKGGLTLLTKSLATEYGPFGIQTNAIGPGYFLTDLTQPLADDPEFDAWVKKEVPLARWGKPEELIGSALFLASDASSYVNGHTIYVDGGWQACL